MRLIWSISTHYNTADRISNLLRTISNEIIRKCQESIDLGKILNPGGDNGGAVAEGEENAAAAAANQKGGEGEGAVKPKGDLRLADVKESMVLLQQCIDCGRKWKEQYQLTCSCIKKNDPARPWNFSEGTIFAQIDAFVQRCCDLLEIAEE